MKAVNKAYTAVVIPNAIELLMINGEKYLFSSFVQRDKTLALMHQIWTHAKTNDKSNDANNNAVPLTNKEVYELICQNYGDNLGQISQMEFNLWFGNDCVVDDGEVDVVSVEKDVEIVEDGHDSINTTEQSINEEATLDVSKEQNEQLKTDCSTNLKSDVLDTTTDLTQTTNEQLANSFMLEHNCSCEQHDGMFVVEHEFACSADAFYNFVFVKTDFIRFLFESRDTYDLVISEWTDFVNNNGNTSNLIPLQNQQVLKTRKLNYTVNVNIPLLKCAMTHEQQYLLECKLNSAYTILCQVKNEGVPYSDSFVIFTKWCITNSGPQQCRLMFTFNLVYTKSSWSLSVMKSSIEKNSLSGMKNYLNDFVESILKEKFCRIEEISSGNIVQSTPIRRVMAPTLEMNAVCHSSEPKLLNSVSYLKTFFIWIFKLIKQLNISDNALTLTVYLLFAILILNIVLLGSMFQIEKKLEQISTLFDNRKFGVRG